MSIETTDDALALMADTLDLIAIVSKGSCNNYPCPCGSGKKLKKCCKGKIMKLKREFEKNSKEMGYV